MHSIAPKTAPLVETNAKTAWASWPAQKILCSGVIETVMQNAD